MTFQLMRVGIVVFGLGIMAVPGWAAENTEQAFYRGQKLIAGGELRAAAEALKAAVLGDLNNQDYLRQFMATRQALKYQMIVESREASPHWNEAADGLSLYYRSQGHHDQALPVDEVIYQKRQTTDAAVQLAETLLAVDQAQRAAELLGELSSKHTTPASQALLCVALARQGDLEQARRIATELQLASDADAFTRYLAARAQAAVGKDTLALNTLKRCYESVPPSRLGALKSHTKSCSDFVNLVSTEAFDQVLQTESKVPESKCSGGSSCSNCPIRGKCSRGSH